MFQLQLKRLFAGSLLTVGSLFLVLPVLAALTMPQQNKTPEEVQEDRDAILASLVIGIPTSVWGLQLKRKIRLQERKQESDRLQSIFYQLLKEGNGYVTVLRLAMEGQLPANAAKQYLDEKSQEFNAVFDVSDEGIVYYKFNEFFLSPVPEINISPALEETVSASMISISGYWTLGSGKEEVLKIQGTPTSVKRYAEVYPTTEVFYYGNSTIGFKKGKVVEYNNCENNLKVCV